MILYLFVLKPTDSKVLQAKGITRVLPDSICAERLCPHNLLTLPETGR